jgi:hypothetical protein
MAASHGVPAKARTGILEVMAPPASRSDLAIPSRSTIGINGSRPPSRANPRKQPQNEAAPSESPAVVIAGT